MTPSLEVSTYEDDPLHEVLRGGKVALEGDKDLDELHADHKDQEDPHSHFQPCNR